MDYFMIVCPCEELLRKGIVNIVNEIGGIINVWFEIMIYT